MTTHTAIAATALKTVSAISVPTPSPSKGTVLVRIGYAAIIPYDVYVVDQKKAANLPAILGWNAAGKVVRVGEDVEGLSVGDEVIGVSFDADKSIQQYGLYPINLCAKVPPGIPLPAAVTIPENFITAFYTLFDQLSVPLPPNCPLPPVSHVCRSPIDLKAPFMIYGAGTNVGQFLVQLLAIAGYQNIITTASPSHKEYLSGLGATHVLEYHSPTLREDVFGVTDGRGIVTVVDCIATTSTLAAIVSFLSTSEKPTVAILTPIKAGSEDLLGGEFRYSFSEDVPNPFAANVKVIFVAAIKYMENEYLRKHLVATILPAMLTATPALKPTKYLLLDSAYGNFLQRVLKGLDMVRRGDQALRGRKLVVTVD